MRDAAQAQEERARESANKILSKKKRK